MDNRGFVKVILKSVPDGESRERVVSFLTCLSKKTDANKISLLINNAPVVLFKRVPIKTAEKIVSNLNKLGAAAIYKPLSPSPEDIKTTGQPRKPDVQKIPNANKPGPAFPSSEKRASKNKTHTPVLLGLFLILLICYSFFYLPDNPVKKNINKLLFFLKTNIPQLSTKASKPKIGPLKLFDLNHAPYMDLRIVKGMAEGFEEYARLFQIKQKKSKKIRAVTTFLVNQVDLNRYKITYKVTIDKKEKDYEIIYSTSEQDISKNIQLFSQTLKSFSHDSQKYINPVSSIKKEDSGKLEEMENRISAFDDSAMIFALRTIGEEITPEKIDPLLLLNERGRT